MTLLSSPAVHVSTASGPLDRRSLVEALARETTILEKRVAAAKSRVLVTTAFLPAKRAAAQTDDSRDAHAI